MPPRSFYGQYQKEDYLAITSQFFPEKVEKAEAFASKTGLPFIDSVEMLAMYVGVETSLLRQILHRPSYHYRTFKLKKRNGGTREINSPKTYLKVVQWWLLDNIFSHIALNDCIHGFRKGRSFITNAKLHFGRPHLLCMDIEGFFPSIDEARVANLFQRIGYDPNVAHFLAQLTTLHDELPQGSPCSPSIANLVFEKADQDIEKLCADEAYLYTRYADDITISAHGFIDRVFAKKVATVIESHGFKTNKKKTRFSGRGDRMEITGVIVNRGLNLPRSWRYRAKSIFHAAAKSPQDFSSRLTEIQGLYGALRALDQDEASHITRKGRQALEVMRVYLTGKNPQENR